MTRRRKRLALSGLAALILVAGATALAVLSISGEAGEAAEAAEAGEAAEGEAEGPSAQPHIWRRSRRRRPETLTSPRRAQAAPPPLNTRSGRIPTR